MSIDGQENPINLAPTRWGEPLPPGRGVSPHWCPCYHRRIEFWF